MTYLAHPAHYTPEEFRTLIRGLKFDKGWRPEFPTLHNTGVPSLRQWQAMGAVPQERWGANLNAYYKGMGWHAGPHVVCCPSYIWLLCDPEADGVSVSCWNRLTFGIEMVGDFEPGRDDFNTGDGARVRDNAVFVLATLADKFAWDIGKTLHFHRECAQDHHACPGSLVVKSDIVARVAAQVAVWKGVSPPAEPSKVPLRPAPDLATVAGVQAALAALGYGETKTLLALTTAVRSFQRKAALDPDGIVGPLTKAALLKQLAGG